MQASAMLGHTLGQSAACLLLVACGLRAQDAVPRIEDNPYVAVAAKWTALPEAVRNAASGSETGSGEELRNMPAQLAALWTQVDAIPASNAPLAWQTDEDPPNVKGLELPALVKARIHEARTPAEKIAALRMGERMTGALQSNALIAGRVAQLRIQFNVVEQMTQWGASLDAAAARELLASLPDEPVEADIVATLRAEREMFVDGAMRRLKAWRAAREGKEVEADWTLAYEVNALGHGERDTLLIGFRERATGRSFIVWSDKPAEEGIEIVSVDVPHDRAVVSKGGVQAEVRLSDHRLGNIAFPISPREARRILAGNDPGATFKTDRDIEAFLEERMKEAPQLEAFFGKLPPGPISAEAWEELENWPPGPGKVRESAKGWEEVRSALYVTRVNRDILRTLLEAKSSGTPWASEATLSRIQELGVGASVDDKTLKIEFPATREYNRVIMFTIQLAGDNRP